MMHASLPFMIAFLLHCAVLQAADIGFAKPPAVSKQGATARVSFAISASTDVEVAVLNAKGEVVRHLAAGVLGGEKAPPAPLKPGLAQRLAWDGKDDFGKPASGGPFKFRVRVDGVWKAEKEVSF